jgi:hypothetical protein
MEDEIYYYYYSVSVVLVEVLGFHSSDFPDCGVSCDNVVC